MIPKNIEDKIFTTPLSFKETLKATRMFFSFYKKDIFLSFFVFFVLTLVFQAVVFKDIITHPLPLNPDLTNQVGEYKNLLLFNVVSLFFQELFFSGLVLFVMAFFEKKIIYANIFLKALFQKSFFFIFTLLLLLSFTVAGLLAFILPGILLVFFFSFALFLVFTENLFGLQALKESFRTIKPFWFKVLLYFIILNAIKLIFSLGIEISLSYIKIPWIELKFLISNLILYLLLVFPSAFFALFFFNLRHQVKPKDQNQQPVT